MDQFVSEQPVGSTFWVKAEDLGMTDEQFGSVGSKVAREGGGDGYLLVGDPHVDSDTTGMIDMLRVKRTR